MAKYLVVAHQTASSPGLEARLRAIAAEDAGAEFTLLVPATHVSHLLTWEEGDSERIARDRAAEAAASLRAAGLRIDNSVVGPADPLQAIREAHERSPQPYAGTIISTLPPGISRWLKRDLSNQVRRQLHLPVIEVVNAHHDDGGGRAGDGRPAEAGATGSALDLAALVPWRGRDLLCADGIAGRVDEIVYDYVTLEPVWLGIASHPLPFRTLLVPVGSCSLSGGRLVTNLGRGRIFAQPPVAIGEGPSSLTDEEHVYAYFGLPFEMRDMRVLRAGQELPGGERNQQAIFQEEAEPASRSAL